MPEFKISAIPYEECKNDLISFRNANRNTERDEAYFDWRYLGRAGGLEPVVVWAESAKGRKVGSMSIVPNHFLADNAVRVFGILGDISVSEDFRGRGIARQMLDFLPGLPEIREFDGCIVLPNAPAARSLEKAGWKTITRLERYIKLLNVDERLKKKTSSKVARALLSPLLNSALSLCSYETFLPLTKGFKGEATDGFDERFDDLWDRVDKDGMVIGFRNREYLTWRYASHPVVKYNVYTISRESALYGYLVFHNEAGTCYIDDLMARGDKEHHLILMSHFLNYIKGAGSISSVVMRSNQNDMMFSATGRFGFFKRLDNQKLMVNFNNEHIFAEGAKWYLTAGDKDV